MARKIQPKNKTPLPKPGQSSEDYWRERETRQRAANIRDEARFAARINDIFQSTQDSIQQEIESFYQRYAKKEEIDISEARRRVSKIDMEKYERLAAQYVKAAHEGGREAAFSDIANEQMRLYNATMRINRLEMLKARCGIRAMEGYRLADQLINEALEERTYTEYERLAGILGNSVQFNENMVRSIVNASYQNATWSQRLWNNQALLSERIGAQIAQGILTGKGSDVLARNIQKLTGQSAYNCQRLMRTELRRVQTAAAEQSMLDNGVTEYKFMVANGVNPCDECLSMDGKVFKISEMSVGKNAPPKHPSCHCCTAPALDEEKWQRWLDGSAQAGEPWAEFEKEVMPIPAGAPLDSYRKKKANSLDNDLKAVNPGYAKDKSRHYNCQRCVVAYELRKRGYDVISRPVLFDDAGNVIYDDAFKNSYNVFLGMLSRIKSAGSFDGKNFIEKRLLEFGEGARVQVSVVWEDSKIKYQKDGEIVEMQGGHTFIGENNAGKIRFIDPQTGNENCEDYFTKVKKGHTIYSRIDDLPVNEELIGLFVSNRGGNHAPH